MALLSQVRLIARSQEIEAAAGRSLQQFQNSFDAVLADLSAFDTDVAAAGFDQSTLDEINAIRSGMITQAQTEIQARLDQLATL